MTKRQSTIALAALLLLLLAPGCGTGRPKHEVGANAAASSPAQLKSIKQLQGVFNSASREPTLVVLIAPT